MKKLLNNLFTAIFLLYCVYAFWAPLFQAFIYLKDTFHWGRPEAISFLIVCACIVIAYVSYELDKKVYQTKEFTHYVNQEGELVELDNHENAF